jgi:hypothetical protein
MALVNDCLEIILCHFTTFELNILILIYQECSETQHDLGNGNFGAKQE